MDTPETGFQREFQPLVEPIIKSFLTERIKEGRLSEDHSDMSVADMRNMGVNPDALLQIDHSLLLDTLGFLQRELPPGNEATEDKMATLLSREEELAIRQWALLKYTDNESEPIMFPLQKLINEAGDDFEILKAMIVAKGQRYNFGHDQDLVNRNSGFKSTVALPLETPTILQEKVTNITSHCLPVLPESTEDGQPMPFGMPRMAEFTPFTDRYIVDREEDNKEISQFIAKTPSLQKFYHGLELIMHQESCIKDLRGKMFEGLNQKGLIKSELVASSKPANNSTLQK